MAKFVEEMAILSSDLPVRECCTSYIFPVL